jgi:hypothetical protein
MKKIEFYPTSKSAELVVSPPKPASQYIPKWYKEIKPFDGSPVFKDGEIDNKNVKSCLPFLDSMVSGYIQETWCDIHISFKNNELELHYAHQPPIVSVRKKLNISISEAFAPFELAWNVPWLPKLEKGYSCLFSHPFNNFTLPFLTTSGIIDSDYFYMSEKGNYPFYLYRDFSGIIPCGTPMYQFLPVKRDSWKSSTNTFDEEKIFISNYKIHKVFSGSYKKLFHQKKYYQ